MKKVIKSDTGIGKGESQFKSDVYNALGTVAFKYQDYMDDPSQMQDAFEVAFEWFIVQFFNNEEYKQYTKIVDWGE